MATAPSCPNLIGDPAVILAANAWGTFQTYGSSMFAMAQAAITDLSAFTIQPFNFNASFDINPDLGGFNTPNRPDEPKIHYDSGNLNDPGDLAFNPVGQVNFGPAPPDNLPPVPSVNISGQPGNLTATDPGDPPIISVPIMPDEPDVVLPESPIFLPITLPDFPTITLPTFTAVAPTVDFTAPGQTFNYQEGEYTTTMLTTLQSKITEMIGGTTGLPAAIEQALYDRAAAREEEGINRALDETTEEYAARGFSEPSGILAKRLATIRQDGQNKRSSLLRENLIEVRKIAIENVKFAVTQGISLEGQLIQLFNSRQQRLLDAAKVTFDVSVRIFEARVALFDAQNRAFAVQAQVYEIRIRGELAKVEVLKAQIDAQRLIGEINKDLVERYKAQTEAVKALIEYYGERVNARKIEAEANATILQGYKYKVEAYGERVRAYVAEWEGFKAKATIEEIKARIYESAVNAFRGRVAAWSETNASLIAQKRLLIDEQDQALRIWLGKVQRLIADIQAERDRVNAQVQIFQGLTQLYVADGQIAQASAETDNRQFQLLVEKERAKVDGALKSAEINVQQAIQIANLLLRDKETLAQVSSNLAAAALSAMHASASVGSTRSDQQSCETQYTLTGELS